MHKIAIIGAGIWGTALAVRFAKNGSRVHLWGRNRTLIARMAATRCNESYLPDIKLPDTIECHEDFATAITAADIILLVTPTPSIRQLTQRLAPLLNDQHLGLAWAAKGIEAESGCWIHEIILQTLHCNLPLATISGPSFAHEVAMELPTALVVASAQKSFADTVAAMLHGDNLRVYTTDDIMGVECGGAVKNVIAIAAGIAAGLGLGENAKAALVTRGIAEVIRFSVAVGGRSETIVGLSGIGDIVLSCSSSTSRNQKFGKMIVKYGSSQKAYRKNTTIVEGVETARAVLQIAQRHKIEMPICETIALILADRISAAEAVQQLLQRPATFKV